MNQIFVQETKENIIPILPVVEGTWSREKEKLDTRDKNWLESTGFSAKGGEFRIIPNENGSMERVIVSIEDPSDPFALGTLSNALPHGVYRIAGDWNAEDKDRFALGWGLGAYQFERYKQTDKTPAILQLDATQNVDKTQALVTATALVRDLINTPIASRDYSMPSHQNEPKQFDHPQTPLEITQQ